MDRIAEVWKLWEDAIRKTDPKSGYIGNLGGGIRTVKNVKQLCDLTQWFYADYQGRATDAPIWLCAQQGRDRGVRRSKADCCECCWRIRHRERRVGGMRARLRRRRRYGWRRLRRAEWSLAFTGSEANRRTRAGGNVGREYFQWIAKHEEHFRNRESIANLAVLYPQSTISFYGAGGKSARTLNGAPIDAADFLDGMYEALLQGRFVFDFVHQDNLNEAALKKYAALLIPNAAYLSDRECECNSCLCGIGRLGAGNIRDLALQRVGRFARRFGAQGSFWRRARTGKSWDRPETAICASKGLTRSLPDLKERRFCRGRSTG